MTLNLDKTEWKRVTMGEVAAASKEKVDPSDGTVERFIAGEHMNTDDLQIHRWGDVGEVDLGPAFHRRFRSGQVLYGSRRTYLRKVAVAEFDGVCSNTTFAVETKDEGALLQEFLPFIMTAEPFHAFAIAESKGSVNPYVNWSDIDRYEFDLPPVGEQKRIAGLFWALERHVLAMNSERDAASVTLGRFALHRLSMMPTTMRLGDVATTRSGPSFAASDVHDSPVKGSVPVLGIPNTKPDGTIDLTEVGHVTDLSESLGKIDESSLVLIRTNGNRQRIGNVYLPPAEADGHAVSAFQFLMKSNDPVDREYLYWVLKEPTMQGRMSEAASGTVGLGNLAVRWLNEQQIPWSTDAAKLRAMVDEMRNLSSAVARIESERAALLALRWSLSADVFGGS